MQATLFRSPAFRTLTSQSIRCLASKPPPSKSKPPVRDPLLPAKGPLPVKEPLPATPASSLPSLDFLPSEQEESQERTGARSSKDSLSSIERQRRFLGRLSAVGLLLGAGAFTWYLGREWEEDELRAKKMKVEDAPSTPWGRMKSRFTGVFDTFTEPLWPELLPPPLPAPHQKPYTLLISIDDLLVTSTWDRQHGWRTAKRPGVDYFLAYLSLFYEVVIFTTQYHYTAIPIIEKLDPYQFFISYKLFRDGTRSIDGQPVKDLTYLNRDLSKVILLDAHAEHASAQPENAIIVPQWDGKPNDKGLIAMIPFLESIAIYKPTDVRPILQAYHGKDIPVEYAKKEAAEKQKFLEEWHHNRKGLSQGGFTLSSLFGGSSDQHHNSPVPLTYLEQKRRDAQAAYFEEKAYIESNKPNFDRMLKEDQEAMAREMTGTFWGAAQAVLTGAPPAEASKKDKDLAAGAASPGTVVPVTVVSDSGSGPSTQKPAAA